MKNTIAGLYSDSVYDYREKETTGLAERIERIEKFLTENLLKEPSQYAGLTPNLHLLTYAAPSATPPSVNHHESPTESHPSSYTHDYSRESSTFNEKSGSSSVPLHFAGRELGCINLFTGIPLLLPEGKQWVQSRTGQNISLSKLVTSNKPPWERQRALASNALVMNPHPESAFELPDRTLIDTYFILFCISFVRRIFPVVDPVLFKETIENAYQQPRTRLPYGKVSTRACVLAFAAFISLVPPLEFETEFRKFAPLNSEAYFTRTQCLVPQVLQESASVEGLQVVSMMVSPDPLSPLWGLCPPMSVVLFFIQRPHPLFLSSCRCVLVR